MVGTDHPDAEENTFMSWRPAFILVIAARGMQSPLLSNFALVLLLSRLWLSVFVSNQSKPY